MSIHEEDILGKAYDARLMRRLLTYLRPYKRHVGLATAAIIGHSALELAPPYLVKLIIDRYIPARDVEGLTVVAMLYLRGARGVVRTRVHPNRGCCSGRGSGSCSTSACRSTGICSGLDLRFYDRNPVGRLMTRVTTDVGRPQRSLHRPASSRYSEM
jgi:ATP-binding cassette subfamily B protein